MKRNLSSDQELPSRPLTLLGRMLPFLPIPLLLALLMTDDFKDASERAELLWALAILPFGSLAALWTLSTVRYRIEGPVLLVQQGLFRQRIDRSGITAIELKRLPFSSVSQVCVRYRKGVLTQQIMLRLAQPERGLTILKDWLAQAGAPQ